MNLIEGIIRNRMTMSNKKTIKRTAEPIKQTKEKKTSGFGKSRLKPIDLIPALLFIGVAIWYFVSSLK
jgi:hypothetical protein